MLNMPLSTRKIEGPFITIIFLGIELDTELLHSPGETEAAGLYTEWLGKEEGMHQKATAVIDWPA